MVDVNNLVAPGSDLTLVEIEHISDEGEMITRMMNASSGTALF
jgi:hypothetical protein